MRILLLFLLLTLVGAPLHAQEEALPPGCNTGILAELFGSLAEGLPQETIPLDLALYIIDVLQDSLGAMRSACSGEIWSDPDAPDYSRIPQSRMADGAYVLGDPGAPVTVVEFADFLCPHCQTYHATMRQVIDTYVTSGQARLEYRLFPVVDPFASSLTANLVECADTLQPGSFWRAHDLMYELTAAGFNGLTHFTFAARAGLDFNDMMACVNEQADQIITDSELAQASGVTGTPTIMLRDADGELVFIEDQNGNQVRSSIPFFILESIILAAQ